MDQDLAYKCMRVISPRRDRSELESLQHAILMAQASPITPYLTKNSKTTKVVMTRYLESETSSTHIIKVYILCIDRDMCVGETIMVRG